LRQALFNLRQMLGDQTASTPYLLISHDTVQFNRESDYSLDLAEFNQRYLSCKASLSQGAQDGPACPDDLEEMVELYHGEFLQGFYVEDSDKFEDWALVQRESTHQHVLDAHSYLADYYESHRDFRAARKHASRQLELDPWREEAHRQLMRVLALDGQRGAALAQYETSKRVLAQELDVEPSAETRELYEQIRLGTLAPETGQPSRLAAAPIHNLPVELTPFVGREAELAQLGELIADPGCRCITLVGPGGIGKTRLAVQAAGNYASAFAHGVAFVSLASVGSVEGVIPAITNAIHFSFYGPSTPKVQLLNYLQEKQLLLVLDNLEQLLIGESQQEYIADLLVEMLQQAPGVKLLVTTREALNLQGEWIFEVSGLAFPEVEQGNGFGEFDAIALFVQRARRVLPGFALTEGNRAEVARICRLVGGMPLAIELAATWMRVLSPAEIVKEIESSLDFLSTTARDLPERHRSMRVVFDHSWQMLSPDEQQVLCKLSVFQGGFQRQAAEQVAGATLSSLSTLVNRTLLRRTVAGRYDLHELIRQYSMARLAADPQTQTEAKRQHCHFYLNLAESAEQGLKGRGQLEWLSALAQDHDNLRAALDCSLEHDGTAPDGDELALRLAGALRWYWRIRGHLYEGRDWLMKALYHYPERQSAARASALLGLSLVVNGLGDMSMSSMLAEQSTVIYRELGRQRDLAEALSVRGFVLRWQGEHDLSHALLEEALVICRRVGDRWGEAQALFRLGSFLADYSGDLTGRAMLIESATILDDLGEKYLYTNVLVSLGIVDIGQGNYAAAQENLERSLAIAREINHPLGTSDALTNLGCLFRIQGNYAAAQSCFEESLRIYREHGHSIWETDVLCALAENDLAQGACSGARFHLQATSSLLESSENKWLQVVVRYFRGLMATCEGDAERASVLLGETITLARQGQYKPDLARSLIALGRVRLAQGEVERADELIREGLGLFRELGHKLGLATALEALAMLSAQQGDGAQAVQLFSTAQALRQALGAPLPPVDRPAYDAAVAACRVQLGEAVFSDLWARAAAQ
jgi:predicted ATPase/DNA-binding SARP family transcriptional activator